jgi:hypothetical protein
VRGVDAAVDRARGVKSLEPAGEVRALGVGE